MRSYGAFSRRLLALGISAASSLCIATITHAQDAAPEPAPAIAEPPEPAPPLPEPAAAIPEPPPAPAIAEPPVEPPPAADAPVALTDPYADLFDIDIHAFVSQGFLLGTGNNYFARSKDGSFEFTEAAINFTKPISDQLRVGMQLFSRKVGNDGGFVPYFDWYYVDYRVTDWFGIRAGRTKIPFGLYNESNDVDAAHVPALLPQSLYPSHHREILLALTGGEIYGNFQLGPVGQLEYRLYGGTFSLSALGPPANPALLSQTSEVRYLAGGRLMWLTPIDGLQAGASLQFLKYDINSTFKPEVTNILKMAGAAPLDFDGTVELEFPIQLWVASIEYATGDLLLAAEYGRWWADLKSSDPALIPSHGPTNERYYAMASYRFLPWFTPGVYYSARFDDVEKRDARQQHQHDFVATLRFDLTENWLLKLEVHGIRGTQSLADQDVALNGGKEPKDLKKNWSLFVVKTTAYF